MKITLLLFLLGVLLISAVYYVGVSSDILAGTRAGQILGYTVTGRNAQGVFQGYPGGNAQVFQPTF